MNGRAVFNFSAISVPAQVTKLIETIGYNLDDIDLFIFHQGSKFIVDTLVKRLNLDPNKVPSNLLNLGNTVSSSIPIILEEYINKNNYKKILISGFGVGLSWASSILIRV